MIEQYTFGKIFIGGVCYTADIKVVHKKVIPTWWRKSSHRVDVDDIKDILESKHDYLVIGKGEPGQMKSTRSLRKHLHDAGIQLVEESTSKAVVSFNQLLADGQAVSAGFHLSC